MCSDLYWHPWLLTFAQSIGSSPADTLYIAPIDLATCPLRLSNGNGNPVLTFADTLKIVSLDMRFQLSHLIGQVLRVAILAGSIWPSSLAAGTGSHLLPASYLSGLPNGISPTGAAVDSDGNLLVAGTVPAVGNVTDAFVAKFTPDGRTRLYFKVLGGKSTDVGGPITVDGSGNAYVTGATNSGDFPTTPGAYQSAAEGVAGGFVVKLDPKGQIVYSTLYYPGSDQSTHAGDIAVNSSGEVFLTGQSVGHYFTTTPGSPAPSNPLNVFFVLRLSADGGRVIYSAGGGIGGARIAVDAGSNAYVVGATLVSDGREVPVTANAYQQTFPLTICGASRAFAFPCNHQHITKLSPTGQIVFCTFLTGTIQDSPSGIAVDANGDVYITGTTSSTDYPVTADALQKQNRVLLPPAFPQDVPLGFSLPQPQTGYLSKLSADGSQLLYSTYVGGSRIDGIAAMKWDQGQLDLLANVQSPDFPMLPSAAPGCLPARTRGMAVVVRFDAATRTISDTTLITGGGAGGFLAANPVGGVDVLLEGPYLASFGDVGVDVADPVQCVFDAMDQTPSSTVSPGQLVTVLGNGIGPKTPLTYDGSRAVLPLSLGGASVLVNGVPAPLMYAAENQINFIIPYEVAGQQTASMKVMAPGGATSTRTARVVERNPTVATNDMTDFPLCDGLTPSGSISAVVLNEDLTSNSCENPAKPGSQVFLFLNGTGVNHPGSTGANPGSGVPLEPTLTEVHGHAIAAAVSIVSAPLGIWEVATRVVADARGFNLLGFSVNGVRLPKAGDIAVWVSH